MKKEKKLKVSGRDILEIIQRQNSREVSASGLIIDENKDISNFKIISGTSKVLLIPKKSEYDNMYEYYEDMEKVKELKIKYSNEGWVIKEELDNRITWIK